MFPEADEGSAPSRLTSSSCALSLLLGLEGYLREPGDGRRFPQIAASSLVWALILSKLLRVASFRGGELPPRWRGSANGGD